MQGVRSHGVSMPVVSMQGGTMQVVNVKGVKK